MKLNKNTKAGAATSAKTATATAQSAKSAKATVKAEAKAKAVKLVGERVALVEGSKGSAFRLGLLYSDNSFKLTQNNAGLKYDGALVSADSSKWDKETRLQIGDYIAARGARVKLSFMTKDQARKLAARSVVFERNGHELKCKVVGKADKQYMASIELVGKNRVEHFFQLETKKLKTNVKHYGALITA